GGGAERGAPAARNGGPRSASTPTDAPLVPWTWIFEYSPGFCDTLATTEPSPPFLKRIVATAVSSTSTVGWLRFAQYPLTSAAGPISHSRMSSGCADWFTSTPPPSVSHRPRHGSER